MNISGAIVQRREFIGPSLSEIMLLEFLQDGDLLQHVDFLLFIQLVLEKVPVGIPGCHIDKCVVELKCMDIIVQLQFKLTE